MSIINLSLSIGFFDLYNSSLHCPVVSSLDDVKSHSSLLWPANLYSVWINLLPVAAETMASCGSCGSAGNVPRKSWPNFDVI